MKSLVISPGGTKATLVMELYRPVYLQRMLRKKILVTSERHDK